MWMMTWRALSVRPYHETVTEVAVVPEASGMEGASGGRRGVLTDAGA